MVDPVPRSLLAALADLMTWLDEMRAPSMIIGGVAASILGRPRLTQDVDALVMLADDKWQALMESAHRFGIFPRIDNALEFSRRSRVLLMRHHSSGVDLDITFGGLPFEQAAIDNCAQYSLGGVSVRLPRIEDLLVMKAIARRWVSEFATATGMSDMLVDFDRLTS